MTETITSQSAANACVCSGDSSYLDRVEQRSLSITNGVPVSGPGWVYAWLWPDGVAYVGATWLDPAVRAMVHLDQSTDDPRSVALRAIVARRGSPQVILAFEAANDPRERQRLKLSLTAACRTAGLLSDDFISREVLDGTEMITTPEARSWTLTALASIEKSLRQAATPSH